MSTDVTPATEPSDSPGRPFADLRDSGLLWLLNRVVFHPRGYALALHYPHGTWPRTEESPPIEATGWSIFGDGTEPWSMGIDPTDEERAKFGALSEDELFARIRELMP